MSRWVWLAVGLAACGNPVGNSVGETVDCTKRLEAIGALEAELFGDEVNPRGEVRGQLIRDYADFANACNGEEQAPEMLFRRADLLRSKGAFEEAMTQLRDVHDHFPRYPQRARCAFLVGFIAETELGDREQARLTYQQVIEVHPESEEAEWARISLAQLDLRADELLRNFQPNESVE